MAAHMWELSPKQPLNDRFREYVCTRCGAGPVQKDVFDDKDGFAKAAKKANISIDCNLQIAKEIMES